MAGTGKENKKMSSCAPPQLLLLAPGLLSLSSGMQRGATLQAVGEGGGVSVRRSSGRGGGPLGCDGRRRHMWAQTVQQHSMWAAAAALALVGRRLRRIAPHLSRAAWWHWGQNAHPQPLGLASVSSHVGHGAAGLQHGQVKHERVSEASSNPAEPSGSPPAGGTQAFLRQPWGAAAG